LPCLAQIRRARRYLQLWWLERDGPRSPHAIAACRCAWCSSTLAEFHRPSLLKALLHVAVGPAPKPDTLTDAVILRTSRILFPLPPPACLLSASPAPPTPSPTTSLLRCTMAAFVPTVAAPGCSWTPAARAVCTTRALRTGAPAVRRPARRVRAGRVTVTAAAKPVDVTADSFDAEVMQSVRFAVMQGHCGLVVPAGSGVCW